MSNAQPGWYPTEHGDRYWDGQRWTHHTRANMPTRQKKGGAGKVVLVSLLAVVGLFFLVGVFAVATGGGGPTPLAPAGDRSVDLSGNDAAEPESSGPELSVSQEQAVRSAQSYLDYSAFSRKGLIRQLKYEGFSGKDAKFAVDHVGADWNEQAAKSAQEYLDYSSFSRAGLIDQLEFEGFTTKQAQYGADQVGL